MTPPNSRPTISHVEVAALVTRLALKRLEANAGAPELTWVKSVLDRMLERAERVVMTAGPGFRACGPSPPAERPGGEHPRDGGKRG
jgi:hypothetical protein